MNKKYWTPAIERSDIILMIIAKEPKQLKLMDISVKSNINKSSLFSLLNTLNELGWVYKESDQTYSLGSKLGFFSAKFIQQFDLTRVFEREAEKIIKIVEETIQLSIIEDTKIIYIAKKEALSRVRVSTEPGMSLPAHATAMGKAMLSSFSKRELEEKYKGKSIEKLTKKTVDTLDGLIKQLNEVKNDGYIVENEETIKGFTCIAAPVFNEHNKINAAVSFTMDSETWKRKEKLCKEAILVLSKSLSMNSHL